MATVMLPAAVYVDGKAVPIPAQVECDIAIRAFDFVDGALVAVLDADIEGDD